MRGLSGTASLAAASLSARYGASASPRPDYGPGHGPGQGPGAALRDEIEQPEPMDPANPTAPTFSTLGFSCSSMVFLSVRNPRQPL